MTGMTLKEYIRRRRLTLVAFELQNDRIRVIDAAVKYGWESADAFAKAFVRQHGITSTKSRNPNAALKIYPPAFFSIMIKGAREMNFRIIDLTQTDVFRVSRQFDSKGYKTKEELRHILWSEEIDNVPGQICAGYWNEPGNITYDGIWQDGKYMIAREKADTKTTSLEKFTLPHGRYAAFKTERGGPAWEELPNLNALIFESWLPNSKYKLRSDIIIEVLHLWTDYDLRKKNKFYEIWIPVETK